MGASFSEWLVGNIVHFSVLLIRLGEYVSSSSICWNSLGFGYYGSCAV